MSTKKNPVPHTVRRLLRLQKGKTITYYRGNFEADIKHALADDQSAPYGMMLRRVRDESRKLRIDGRIELKTKKIGAARMHGKTVTIYEYTATGL